MDYRYLKAFQAAAQNSSFIKAAHELSISPSAVTRQIALLERSVGGELFIRGNKKVILSELGSRLAESLSIFDSHTRSMNSGSKLRLGCLQSVFEIFMVDIMRKNPKIFTGAIDIEIDTPENLLTKVESGRLDLIISSNAPIGSSTMSSFKLFQEEISWLGGGNRTIVFSAFESHYPEELRNSSDRIWVNSFNAAHTLAKQGFGRAMFATPSEHSGKSPRKKSQWIYVITPSYKSPPHALKLVLQALRNESKYK